jgi:histidinol phosphatase-like enzyme (inositol monophosphatase family)
MSELEKYLSFAREICHEAGKLTLKYYMTSLEVIDKADGSPVTVADREAEKLIRAAIEKTFPDHGICGEEHGRKEARNGSPYTWYIDPIDGTKSFVHGVPLYTCLLGLMREEESVVGVVQLPAINHQLSAATGLGCHLNGTQVRVSQVGDLARAVGLTTDERDLGHFFPDRRWEKLWNSVRFGRTWGDAFGYYLVATGRAEFMIDGKVEPYDVSPLPVIMREAGGKFFDWQGNETIFGGNGIACNAALESVVREHLVRQA